MPGHPSAGTYIPVGDPSSKRRRPSGAPPPLPRRLGTTGKGWLVALVVLVAWVALMNASSTPRRLTDHIDAAVLRAIAAVRNDWTSPMARAVDRVATGWVMFIIGVGLVTLMVIFRRWRHLFTYLACVLLLELSGLFLVSEFARPRPFDVTIIGRWRGFSLPSATAMVVSFTVIGVIYTMVVPGRPRTTAKAIGAAVIAVFVGARLYLGVDHPFDAAVGVALGVAVPMNAFRYFVPNETFPVSYRRGKTAHLEIDERRREAIGKALMDQVGVELLDVEHVGL
ncbi:MAG: hypothetical protein M3501_11570, partial [Actinomycetota bacterium]|nr:hypothetical protein [Actinomycetota bacterium]